jgi:hypothetical protein
VEGFSVTGRKSQTPKRSGYNTNLASEFYVLASLYRRGLDANLTLGNKKAVDIVVVRAPGDTLTIDVKAVAGKVDWLVGNVGREPRPNHFVVLLSYDGRFSDLRTTPSAWVMPHADFLGLVRSVAAPSTMRFISRKQVLEEGTFWRDAWDLLAENGMR